MIHENTGNGNEKGGGAKKSQRKTIKYKKHKHVKSIKILAIEKKGLLSKGCQRGKIKCIKT